MRTNCEAVHLSGGFAIKHEAVCLLLINLWTQISMLRNESVVQNVWLLWAHPALWHGTAVLIIDRLLPLDLAQYSSRSVGLLATRWMHLLFGCSCNAYRPPGTPNSTRIGWRYRYRGGSFDDLSLIDLCAALIRRLVKQSLVQAIALDRSRQDRKTVGQDHRSAMLLTIFQSINISMHNIR